MSEASSTSRAVPLALVTALLSVTVVGFMAWACGGEGARVCGVPVLYLCAALAFAMNWIAFVPSILRRTERYYDLTGSLTFLGVTGTALLASGAFHPRALVLAGLIGVWAIRLGAFLFHRVHADGGDQRFDRLKRSPSRFFVAWTLQAVWVFLTLAAALTAIAAGRSVPPGPLFGLGLAVWLAGFAIEVVADAQKRRFRRSANREAGFITTGLWAWSRHPNYFGEIVLWLGIAIIAAPTFAGTQWVALVSPLFVILLLTKVSGVPLLEKRADEKWGGQPGYESYKARTPVLIPGPPRGSGS